MSRTQAELNPRGRGTPIVIDDRPLMVWDVNHSQTQEHFLRSVDPTYFRYLAGIHRSQLEGEDSLSAAVALRATYSHAVESLFAFIGAAIQAPRCPAGWLLMYKNEDLRNLIEKISGRKPFLNGWNLDRAGWREIVNFVLPWDTGDNVGDEVREASAQLWASLAGDLVDGPFVDEYNSLKHGLRVGSGGWFLNVGAEEVPGVPAPPERMRRIVSSRFGSSFLRSLKVKKDHWELAERRVNWNPEVFARRIPLVADSIENVLTFLKDVNGVDAQNLHLNFINSEMVSEALTDPDPPFIDRLSVNRRINPDGIPAMSRDDILRAYAESSKRGESPNPRRDTVGCSSS